MTGNLTQSRTVDEYQVWMLLISNQQTETIPIPICDT